MRQTKLLGASALALVICTSGAGAAGVGVPTLPADVGGTIVKQVHSVYEAEQTLYRRGYYDVRLERATLPYSFNACRRGTRYHIHVDYYGDLVQVDPIGSCDSGYGYEYRRPYYDRYRYRNQDRDDD